MALAFLTLSRGTAMYPSKTMLDGQMCFLSHPRKPVEDYATALRPFTPFVWSAICAGLALFIIFIAIYKELVEYFIMRSLVKDRYKNPSLRSIYSR